MRRIAIVLLLGAVGCGDSSGPGKLTDAKVNGAWEFTLTKTTSCSALAINGDFYATLDFQGDVEIGNTVSKWTNTKTVPDRYNLIGNIQYNTGETELRFWQVVLNTGVLVEGTTRADGTFTGTGTDPIPGYRPFLSSPSCIYSVVGRKIS